MDVEDRIEKIGKGFVERPYYSTFKWSVMICVLLLILNVVGGFFGIIGGTAQDVVKVAKQEFSPSMLLKKYEWFKDVSAQLDKKTADIKVYHFRITSMEADYSGTSRKDWDRTDKEQMNQWHTELAGVKASYNGLAADYNSQMSKFNWSFTNVGSLPQGATEVLPREHKPYNIN